MPDTTKLSLAFGLRERPDDLRAVWGARLIWPNDLVHDRQDLAARDDEAKEELIHWLNNGAIKNMRDVLLKDAAALWLFDPKSEHVEVIYSDEKGIIKGSPQGSGGYIYVAGWLHKHE